MHRGFRHDFQRDCKVGTVPGTFNYQLIEPWQRELFSDGEKRRNIISSYSCRRRAVNRIKISTVFMSNRPDGKCDFTISCRERSTPDRTRECFVKIERNPIRLSPSHSSASYERSCRFSFLLAFHPRVRVSRWRDPRKSANSIVDCGCKNANFVRSR